MIQTKHVYDFPTFLQIIAPWLQTNSKGGAVRKSDQIIEE